MKALLLVPLSLSLVSCGTGYKRMAMTRGAAPASSAAMARAESADLGDDWDGDHGLGAGKENDSPGEAAEFDLLRRTGGAPLPVEKLLEAKRHKASMPVHSLLARGVRPRAMGPRDMGLGTWQPLGPGNIGGRTRALVIRPDDPNTMYAGSVGGGVWMTTDGGQSWNPLTDLLPSIGISALAMDPNDPNTIYAGTGEWYTDIAAVIGNRIRGAGIFKTADGGATWTQLPKPPTGNAFDYINKIVVSPNNSQNIYVANWAGIHFSPDGGNTWQLQLNRSGNLLGCQDLVIRSDQPTDYLFAACAYGSSVNPGIYRNMDASGAGTWQMVFTTQNLSRTSLALAPSNQSIIYAAASSNEKGDYQDGLLGVFRSTSNGDPDTWETRVTNQDANPLNTVLFTNPRDYFYPVCTNRTSNFRNQGWYDNVVAVDPTNSDVVWVGGIDVFRSDDGGQNWGIAAFWEFTIPPPVHAHADNHAIVFSPGYDGAGNQTLYVTSDGGIFRTDNALAPTATGARAACAPYTTSVVWHNLNHGYAVTQFYHGVVYPGGAAYLGGAQDNETLRGSDAAGQEAWSTPIHTGDGAYSAMDPTDPNTWYASGIHLDIQRTTDGGVTWSLATKGITESSDNFFFIAPYVMDPSQPKRLYIGGKTLWRTADGAQSWSAASAAIPSNAGTISAVAISPADSNTVVFGTSTGSVFRSSSALSADKTTTWSSVQPRTGYLSHLEFDPTNAGIVYATYSQYKQNASQNHVYKSTDGGATWSGIDGSGNSSIPDVPVFTVMIDPQNPSNLYVGSDIGVFVSLDGGATWARDANPFADAPTETLVLDRSAGQNTLFAFTHGRGVWRTALPGSGAPCQYSLSGQTLKLPAYGSSANLNVTTADQCVWSVLPMSSNFVVSSPAVGRGKGTFAVNSRSVNNTAQARSGLVTVQDQAISVTQDAAQVGKGNDEAASAFSAGALPAVVIQDTSSGTESKTDPVHGCTSSADSRTLWFSVNPQAAGTLTLTFFVTRADNGADAGAVMTVYRNVNGAPGAELLCRLLPQTNTAGLYHYYSPTLAVAAGDSYLVEVSATLSGAPAGASLMSGNLTLEAVVK